MLLERTTTRRLALAILLMVGTTLPATRDAVTRDAPSATAPTLQLMVQLGHSGTVASAAFSPDGTTVLTTGQDKVILLWDVATRAQILELTGHEKYVTHAMYSPNGRSIVSADGAGSIRLWDVAQGRQVREFTGHGTWVNSLEFSEDGSELLSAGSDGFARCWRVADGTQLWALDGRAHMLHRATRSPDGARLLTTSRRGIAHLWDARVRERAPTEIDLGDKIYRAQFTPDGRSIVAAGNFKVLTWNLAMREPRLLGTHAEAINALSFSPDGRMAATAGNDGAVRIWDLDAGELHQTLHVPGAYISSARFSPNGQHIVTGHSERTARIWEVRSGQELARLGGMVAGRNAAAFAPDGTRILTADSDGTVRLWDSTKGIYVRSHRAHSGDARTVAWSPDGNQFATGGNDGATVLWDAASGKRGRTLLGHRGTVWSASYSANGEALLTGAADDTARLWDVRSGENTETFKASGWIRSAALSTSGRFVATASTDPYGQDAQAVRLWDAKSAELLRTFEKLPGGFVSVAFSSDEELLFGGSALGLARVWHVASGEAAHGYMAHGGAVLSAQFADGDNELLSAGTDNTACLWRMRPRGLVRRFHGHTYSVMSSTLSPDRSKILTASMDGTVRIWDRASGRQLASLIGFRNGEWAVTDPEGRYDASNAGRVRGLYWRYGREVISLDQLKSRYYEPGLLGKILGHDTGTLRSVEALKTLDLYPAIAARVEGTALHVEATNRGGGIGRIVIRVNGKERTADARGPSPDPDAQTVTLREDLRDDPRMRPGEANHIEVLAYNNEGYLRSRGVDVYVTRPGEAEEPSLWALVVGIADYAGGGLDLRYAAKDAEDIAATLQLAGASLFGEKRCHVRLLTDNEASRAAILEALVALRAARPSDVLALYFAGHGVTHNDQFHYLTAEARSQSLADPAVRRSCAISGAEFADAINDIPANKQAIVFDTCAAGTVIEDLTSSRGTDADRLRALDRLQERTGTFILAGCASDRASYETSRYGQGLLTYSLLLGMRGGQLRQHEFVAVAELFEFATERVPELAKDIGGVQRPIYAVPHAGSSFDLGRLTKEERARVPLRSVRPLLVRSMFMDPDQGQDVLDLGSLFDAKIRNSATTGRDEALVFVDAPSFPGAYAASGTYATAGDTTTVTFRLFRDKKPVSGRMRVEATLNELPDTMLRAVLTAIRDLK